ncbi:MAG TPA: hypothetical protein VGB77_06485 [Abditibacteriaceae bacterium]|jgi:hypothetical protein
MFKRLSNFDDGQLRSCLNRIKGISSLGDEAALIEVDKFIYEILQSGLMAFDDDSDDGSDDNLDIVHQEMGFEELELLKENLAVLSRKIACKERIHLFEGQNLRYSADYIEKTWCSKIARTIYTRIDQTQFNTEFEEIKKRVYPVADEAEFLAYAQLIEETQSQAIFNTSSVQSIYRQLNEATAHLESHGILTDDLRQKIRQSRERAAWHRAKKKLSEAEVAIAGGTSAKAEKLKREAAVLIAQDWSVAFPGETPPDLQT